MLEQGNMTLSSEPASLAPPQTQIRQWLRDAYDLTKPRITFLVLITTFTGMWLAVRGVPPLLLVISTLLGVGMASGSSSAFNNFIDREIDQHMQRTRNRPLPTGRLSPQVALWLGTFLGLSSFVFLSLTVNMLTAALALFTNFFYVVIYTIWLKRWSPLCTSIGGISGALPTVLGVTAVTGRIDTTALALFIIMYLWQPPHFWAIALIRSEEYRRVNIPMLPVVKGEAVTKRQMLIYTVLLLPASLSLFWLGVTGPIYMGVAALLGITYLGLTIKFIFQPVTSKRAYQLFFFSIFYLCLLFVMMFVNCLPA
ncbi:protoheme IX farnesyltransferase [bacterium (Candidatus Blackallbacteria) CG17_big_fil_post_rev_8_21_14_2_50_48_46]|uniref:Protoheme IX farnesyltransferase n=1 Tax=bacterium (Candidatus Blackallbacteria) CG17_big_fil_post_rev_8_21_14_2_50_48_46 TaxID=2014261 RepID=A0A2M7GB58_9BACT|nr:MAG: protoheme IX farnesyltransferase [bacterium (Candidatus Blackallbacteria) CG18_big_fil_WC_8_21_14_2_50_49_26]PIW19415.1 MAG: protoheme IX farnesyltransferase [bacterium (Candidatus Blackallbacteria) CG17_big_fil_post_rev_8_21_14_2_50_48_46]PIW48981.1 MAG: protoheme IX farnesyltransferase [bacterium (Candidatus Blackallbacteria) CG13_big_fil_rev_8_21_14_2_50_49_14]